MSQFFDTAPFDEAQEMTGEAFTFDCETYHGTFNFFERESEMQEAGGFDDRPLGTVFMALGQFEGATPPKERQVITYNGRSNRHKGARLRLRNQRDHRIGLEFDFYVEGKQWQNRP